jgi:gamma-glutamyltranspeptidase/glutathione hydrolase
VTHPCCGNLGGGGYMTIHFADGRNTFINFRERAPLAARADMFLDTQGKVVSNRSLDGYLAAGVPGTVMGLETARLKYGTLPRSELIAPAIKLAEQGFVLTRGDVDVLAEGTKDFRASPNVAAIFLNHGEPFAPGDRLTQKDLAATLRAISSGGADAFYRGAIPAAVSAASRAHGGLLTSDDFAAYTATESAPINCGYRGYTITSATRSRRWVFIPAAPFTSWPRRCVTPTATAIPSWAILSLSTIQLRASCPRNMRHRSAPRFSRIAPLPRLLCRPRRR